MKKFAPAGAKYKSDKLIYQIGHWPVKLFTSIFYRFNSREVRVPEPSLIFCNHTMAADPVLVASAFPKHMYFVASEHVLRHNGSRIFIPLSHPIIRVKGTTESRCAMEILRQLRAGHSVCVFIEGERSWDGLTQNIPESAAHLAQLAKVPLYTYKISGGYLTHPRWTKRLRKGSVWGELINTYTPREIAGMTRGELLSSIKLDLYEDAYAVQGHDLADYKGRKLAEDLETALFLCPECQEIGHLYSHNNHFRCTCGMDLIYDRFGYFNLAKKGQNFPFVTVRDWFAWQRQQVYQRSFSSQKDDVWPLAADDNQAIYTINKDWGETLLGKGLLSLWPDRLIFDAREGQSLEIPLTELDDIACEAQMLLSFVYNGVIHEVRSAKPRAAIKYQLFFRALLEKRRLQLQESQNSQEKKEENL